MPVTKDMIIRTDNNLSMLTYNIDYRYKFKNNINQLLIECFGHGKTSKAITYERNTTKKYYYELENELGIINFVNMLNENLAIDEIKSFKEKKELYKFKGKNKDNLPLCACYDYAKSNKNGALNYDGFIIDFYTIIGVSYHRINNSNKVGASVVLGDRPIFTLESSKVDTFFGIFNDVYDTYYKQIIEGIFYHVNKLVFLHDNFKNFISKLFMLIGSEDNNYIFKDIGRTIMEDGCFLPEISYKQLLKCYTPKDIISQFAGEIETNVINYNKYDINTSYLLIKLYKYIKTSEWSIILNMTPQMVHYIVDYRVLFNGLDDVESIVTILTNYYIRKLNVGNINIDNNYNKDTCDRYIIRDYIRQSIELNEKISLSLTLKQLEQKHDIVTRNYLKKSIVNNISVVKNPSQFDILDNAFLELKNFRRILTDTNLYAEGEYQHNCVLSRKNLLEIDRAAIYHWDYNDESLTIQINCKGNYFWIEEMKARFNADCSWESKENIEQIIRNLNYTLTIH